MISPAAALEHLPQLELDAEAEQLYLEENARRVLRFRPPPSRYELAGRAGETLEVLVQARLAHLLTGAARGRPDP